MHSGIEQETIGPGSTPCDTVVYKITFNVVKQFLKYLIYLKNSRFIDEYFSCKIVWFKRGKITSYKIITIFTNLRNGNLWKSRFKSI